MATAVINQITERVVKGDADGIDGLTFTALSIVRVGLKPATTDFTAALDYKLTGGEVDWSPGGREPQVGQAYYVTYTFQAASSFKDFQQISDEMDVNMRALQPAASTQSGSVTRNLHIDLPATSLADVYGAISRVSSIQSLENLTDFEGTELDDYAANFQVVRGPAEIATGQATFSASAVATAAILIPVGTRVATLSTATQASVFFKTTADATIFPGQSTVTVDIEAEASGAEGNVGSGTVVVINTAILGISSVTNQNPTTGGSDGESDEDFRDRIKASFLANDAVTFRGIRRRALELANVIDALVVGAGDALLVRGGGTGGKVDLYIQAEAGLSRSEVDTATFNSVDIPLLKQPVISISAVFNVTTALTIPPANWLLVKDFGVLTESTSAQDALRVLAGASNGDILEITYTHNAVLEDVQAFFADDEVNAVPARDFLTRAATKVFIDVAVTVKPVAGVDTDGVESGIIDAVAGRIDTLKLGAEIKYRDVFDLIQSVDGIDDVRPLDLLARRGYATAETIQLEKNEFPQTGTITVRFVS